MKNHTVRMLARQYLECCQMTETAATENAAHIFSHVVAIDDSGTIRRKEKMMPFFWLKHTITDAARFQAYRKHLVTHDGKVPDWAINEGFGCDIALVPFLNKGEETPTEFYIPILLTPTEFSSDDGRTALAQTQVIDWQDNSGRIS